MFALRHNRRRRNGHPARQFHKDNNVHRQVHPAWRRLSAQLDGTHCRQRIHRLSPQQRTAAHCRRREQRHVHGERRASGDRRHTARQAARDDKTAARGLPHGAQPLRLRRNEPQGDSGNAGHKRKLVGITVSQGKEHIGKENQGISIIKTYGL